MRDERLYLDDILEAAASIDRTLRGITEEEWVENEIYRDAVLYRLVIIGEAAARLSDELRNRHSDIVWRDIIGFRNFAVHHYFGLNLDVVWYTARHDVPLLALQIAQILRDDFNELPYD
ncbi:MAG: hypothetical protein BWY52_02850 [Chloroflexi bacterium ADurb.Bin325]|nr:MAG: hypothetical protein BWY52_02850 [Chloroflexi bacterium ADurb.Bin325]